MNQVSVGGKQYTMKDVSILRTKMTATKHFTACEIDKMPEWIGDAAKEKAAVDAFEKFLNVILTESYTGPGLLDLPESEVVEVTTLFFRNATVPRTVN